MSKQESGSARLTTTEHVAMFKALGDPTWLRIFGFLCTCCGPVVVEETGDVRPVLGPTVGEVCCQVTGADKITSSVSFHLKELRLAGLITMKRRGKSMICGVNRDSVAMFAAYLSEQLAGNQKGLPLNDCC